MPAIITLIQIYLVLSLMLYSVESAAPLSKRVIVQFTRPASGDLLAQQREGVPGDTLEADALQQKNDFISALKATGLNGNLIHSYTKLFNGVSLNLDNENDLNTLKTLPGVLEVFPVRTSSLDPLHSAQSLSLLSEEGGGQESELFRQTGHTLTGVNIIHAQHPDITGKDVKVGIINTGINYRHPALSIPGQTCEKIGGTGCRVLFGTDLVGDEYDGYNTPQPDDDPMDNCNGHGTNLAGIIGGNYEYLKGIAQQVVFGAYRINGCPGIASEDIALAGLDAAFRDNMQVIILNENFDMNENSGPISQMIDKMSQYGTIIISQAGNEGQGGYGTVTSPGVAKLGIAAASYDNVRVYGNYLLVTGIAGLDMVEFDYPDLSNNKTFEVGKSYNVIVSPQQNAELGDGCTAFQPNTFRDGVALLIRSDLCSYSNMVDNAVNNGGAMGVIIYNSYPALLDRGHYVATLNFPTVFISGSDGMAIANAAITSGSVSVIFEYSGPIQQGKTAGLPSAFSSMGLDLSLLMKPDLGAPGAYMTTSSLGSDLGWNYGTQMAAAYLTGVAALEVQRSGNKTTFSALQRRLHITAKPTMITGSALGEIAMPVAKIGAGLVDVPKFLFSTVDIEPSKLELGDGNIAKTKTIKVTNTGNASLTYTITHLPSQSFKAAGGIPQHLIEQDSSFADVVIPIKEITIAAGQMESFNVTISPTVSVSHVIQSGFIKLDNPADQNGTLTIPYVLMTGVYSDFPLIGSKNPPALYPASFIDDNRIPPFANTDKPIFNLKTRASSPAFIFDLIFPVRHMNVILVASDSKPVGLLWSCPYCQPFMKTKTELILESTISDLTDPTKKIEVLNGTYKIVVQAVRPRPLTPVPNVNEALVTIQESIPFIVDLSATLTSSGLTTTTATPTPTL